MSIVKLNTPIQFTTLQFSKLLICRNCMISGDHQIESIATLIANILSSLIVFPGIRIKRNPSLWVILHTNIQTKT